MNKQTRRPTKEMWDALPDIKPLPAGPVGMLYLQQMAMEGCMKKILECMEAMKEFNEGMGRIFKEHFKEDTEAFQKRFPDPASDDEIMSLFNITKHPSHYLTNQELKSVCESNDLENRGYSFKKVGDMLVSRSGGVRKLKKVKDGDRWIVHRVITGVRPK